MKLSKIGQEMRQAISNQAIIRLFRYPSRDPHPSSPPKHPLSLPQCGIGESGGNYSSETERRYFEAAGAIPIYNPQRAPCPDDRWVRSDYFRRNAKATRYRHVHASMLMAIVIFQYFLKDFFPGQSEIKHTVKASCAVPLSAANRVWSAGLDNGSESDHSASRVKQCPFALSQATFCL